MVVTVVDSIYDVLTIKNRFMEKIYPDNIMTSERHLKDILKFLRRLFRRLKIIKQTS